MRVNLTSNNDNNLPTYYTNINIWNNGPHSAGQLGEFVDDGEAEEFRALNILGLFPQNKSEEILNHWISKVAHKGKLIIGEVECLDVSKAYANGRISIDDFNNLLRGENSVVQTSFSVGQIVNFLEAKGFKILKKRVSNYYFIVEAERP